MTNGCGCVINNVYGENSNKVVSFSYNAWGIVVSGVTEAILTDIDGGTNDECAAAFIKGAAGATFFQGLVK